MPVIHKKPTSKRAPKAPRSHAARKAAVAKFLAKMKPEQLFPEKNKRAEQNLKRAGLI